MERSRALPAPPGQVFDVFSRNSLMVGSSPDLWRAYFYAFSNRVWDIALAAHFARPFNPSACFQPLPSLPALNGTSAPTASISAFRSDSLAGSLMKALMPA